MVEVTADVGEIAELELGEEPKSTAESLPSHAKILRGEELLLMDKQGKWFPEM